jgi:hypothetical protein
MTNIGLSLEGITDRPSTEPVDKYVSILPSTPWPPR